MLKLKVTQTTQTDAGKTAALCPSCGKEVIFDPIGQDWSIGNNMVCGQRRCPNGHCNGHLFVVISGGKIVAAYPPVRIDFKSDNVPKTVRHTFEEALDCHAAGCYTASAIMVRRTLEEICLDRGAKGQNLKKRIKDLESKIVLPQELMIAMEELRLLGNDAAHIEAKTYSKISREELDVAIEFTKEILKALYQYSSLLSRLRSLKKQQGGQDNINQVTET